MDAIQDLLAEISVDESVSCSIWEPPSKRLADLTKLLSETEKLRCFDKHMHWLGTFGRSISHCELAKLLLVRARETDAVTVVKEVEAYLDADTISLEYAFLLPQIHIDSEHRFANGVRLIKLDSIRDSCVRDSIRSQNQTNGIGYKAVTSLLVKTYDVPKYSYPNTETGRPSDETPWPPHQQVDDTRLILSLARGGDYGIPLLASAEIVPKTLSFLDRSVGWSSSPEPLVHTSPEIVKFEARSAENRLQQFTALDDETKDRLRIVMKRLNDTKIESDVVNKFINMRVCLENLFLENSENYGLTSKLVSRIPQHSSLTEAEVRSYYGDMSTAVHNGQLPSNSSTPIAQIIQLIKERVIAVLETGAYPNWHAS